jgi:hypothetical protein
MASAEITDPAASSTAQTIMAILKPLANAAGA